MEGKIYDAAVIGAGIEGSSTAYNLAKNGYDTLLLEQFSLPHTRGSSHGQSRIIRKAYTEEHFARMMPESYDRWAVLERETGKSLFLSTGMLAYGRGSVPREKKAMDSTEHALKQVNCNYEKMNASELRKKFKGFRFQDDHIGLLDKEAGLLRAHPALDAFQEMFRKFGGTLKDDMKVTSILPAEVVTLRTNTGATFRTRRLVIAAGPWTQRLIEPLGIYVPLNPIRVTVCYWRQKADVCSVKSGFPAFINNGNIQGPDGCGYHVYGIPAHEYENLTKVCFHGGIPIDPDFRDVTKETWDVDALCSFVRENLPYLEDKPSVIERCIYTMTPDENFLLDKHPTWKNIAVGAGFSGHGFKLAPVVGKILSELVTDKKGTYDLSNFSISHFSRQSFAKL